VCGACFALRVQAQNWTLVWSDEFNQANGSSPDPAKWGCEVGGTGWGNNELEYYTSRTNNTRIENGQLVIETRRESYGGKDYTSARLLTKARGAWTYGRIEARIEIPRGQGIWPAFWTLGTNISSVGWPGCGEIDIMENIGREPGTIHGTIHGQGYSGGNGIGGPGALPGGAFFADDFHVYAIEWTTNQIQWFVDNHPYFTVTPANLPAGAPWVFTHPQYLLLNVAVGGNWPGNPDATTTFPQRMLVDYVRVYAATETPLALSTTKTNDLLRISFATFLGQTYQIESKNILSDANWQVLTNLIGNGAANTVTDTLGTGQRYYRVSRILN
jgi:beta-glucanase (GH16 family)